MYNNPFRLLVCGGRLYKDEEFLTEALDLILKARAPERLFVLIGGGAQGADTLASKWADKQENMFLNLTYHPLWDEYGKKAGPMRNLAMLKHGSPDLVVAFGGGRGTKDMVKIARKAGVEVIRLE